MARGEIHLRSLLRLEDPSDPAGLQEAAKRTVVTFLRAFSPQEARREARSILSYGIAENCAKGGCRFGFGLSTRRAEEAGTVSGPGAHNPKLSSLDNAG